MSRGIQVQGFGTVAQIVKVQVPLFAIRREPTALVYAEGRDRLQEMTITPVIEAAMGDEPKKFFYAVWDNGAGVWDVDWDRPAPWQDW